MNCTLYQDEERIQMVFTGKLSIEHAAEMKAKLLEALANSESLELDLSDVEEIDLPCLQLVCAAHRSAGKAGKSIDLSGSSGAVAQAVTAAGLDRSTTCANHGGLCIWRGGSENE